MTSYIDGTDANIINVNNSVPYFVPIVGITHVVTGSGDLLQFSGTSATGPGGYDFNSSSISTFSRLNIKYSFAFQIVAINFNVSYLVNGTNMNINC